MCEVVAGIEVREMSRLRFWCHLVKDVDNNTFF